VFTCTGCFGGVINKIGAAGTTAGQGVRIGASRVTLYNKPTAPLAGCNVNVTGTTTQFLDAGIFGFAASAARYLKLPTAAGSGGIVQNMPAAVIGDIVEFTVLNTCCFPVTVCAGAGGTIVNTTPLICSSRTYLIRVTAITSNSETISVY
jgi:hypothetical protein